MNMATAEKILGIKRRWWCHAIAAAFALFIGTPAGYMAADREPPFRLTNGVVTPNEIPVGGTYNITWTLVLKRHCPTSVWQVIKANVDPRLQFSSVAVSVKQESLFGEAPLAIGIPHKIIGRKRDLPATIHPGPITIETWQESYCNVIQRILSWPIVWQQETVYATLVRG